MKTYECSLVKDSIFKTIKKIKKKFDNKINILKANWNTVAPSWAQEAVPHSLQKGTLTMYAKTNPLILKYKEKELIKIAENISSSKVLRIKIIAI